MDGGSPDQAAQHVTASLVRRKDTGRDEEPGAAEVVGEDVEGPLQRRVGGVRRRPGLEALDHRGEVIRAIAGPVALHDRHDPVESQAGIDRGIGQQGPRAVGLLVELHEHQVPELLEAVSPALVLRGAVRPPAGAGAAPVEIQLAVVPARTGRTGRPPVLAQPRDAFAGDADPLHPEPLGLGVIGVDARPETVGVEAQHLGGELPRVVDRPLFEVVADRPVAEHLEERVVRRVADRRDVVVFQSGTAKALLTGGEVASRRGALPGDPGLERHHSGHGEEERRIVVGNERKAREPVMPAFFKEAKKSLPDLRAEHVQKYSAASCRCYWTLSAGGRSRRNYTHTG